MSSSDFRGRVWCFPENVNTELMLPSDVVALPRAERPQHVFRATRPGWAAMVRAGDLLVGGANFGVGSAKPYTFDALKDLGIRAILAESLNGSFFRNCVNYAIPALEVPGVRSAFTEGDEARVNFGRAQVLNVRTGQVLTGVAWPQLLRETLEAGGLIEKLQREGLLQPRGWTPASNL